MISSLLDIIIIFVNKMDGIPRLPMLKIDLKTTKSNIDFKTPIKMV